jgi:2-polyprenyl-6-methoxyphenol hydroxylase-like FAD-dependent oxidoreductase
MANQQTRKDFHVLIIGAGTGGMCLAHGLKRAGISVAVYERDRTRTGGLHGYRVGINADGSRALHDCLPPELFETFVATCAGPMRRMNMLTENLSELLSLTFPAEANPVTSEKSVSRMTLRQVLLTGVEDIVHFDKTFTRYEQHPDRKVTAFFEDGTSATGDLLVAADGTRSRVRQRYLPHATIKDAGVVAVGGKAPLDDARAILPPRMLEGSSMIFAPGGVFSIMHVMEFKWDHNGAVKNGIGGSDAELINNWPGLLYDNTRDYFMWGVSDAARKAPPNILETRGADLIPMVMQMTRGWDSRMHRLFDISDPGATFSINIATSVPVPAWETTNVTLLGDAIHTMTPGRGAGANTALRDARLLCRNLTAARDGKITLYEAVNDYESKMRVYGYQAVEDSLENQGGDNMLYKPVAGRLMLAGMRTGLRLANALPPVKQKMTEGLLRSRGAERVED